MKTYRVLLLGAGFWGSRWIRLLQGCERTVLAGVACDPQSIENVRKQFDLPGEMVFGDYKEAIESVDAQIMVNVLPAKLHYDADRLAIERGLHVIAEKPLVETMQQAWSLLALSNRHPNVHFAVSQNYRWRPHNVAIVNAINSGMIGTLESIRLEFRQQEDLQGYRGALERPLVDDMSIHHFDLLRYFCNGDCASIIARTWRPSWSLYPGEPNLDAILLMKNGVRISYTGTWAARGKETSWDGDILLCGSKGCLCLEVDNHVRFYPHAKVANVVLDTQRQHAIMLDNPNMLWTETEYCLRAFLDSLDTNTSFETDLKDNFASFAMVHACREAARTLQPIDVDTVIQYQSLE